MYGIKLPFLSLEDYIWVLGPDNEPLEFNNEIDANDWLSQYDDKFRSVAIVCKINHQI